ncbi:MAG: hypothetical protein WBD22_03325 [Pyrinomonadaceae bacterium]
MKKLPTTACLFVVTGVATVAFNAPAVIGQETKRAVGSETSKTTPAMVEWRFGEAQPLETGAAPSRLKDCGGRPDDGRPSRDYVQGVPYLRRLVVGRHLYRSARLEPGAVDRGGGSCRPSSSFSSIFIGLNTSGPSVSRIQPNSF